MTSRLGTSDEYFEWLVRIRNGEVVRDCSTGELVTRALPLHMERLPAQGAFIRVGTVKGGREYMQKPSRLHPLSTLEQLATCA